MSHTLNAHQKAVVFEALASQKRTMERAYASGSKASAIKAFCLRCVGYLRNEVRDCTAYGCPLWTHRPYRTDTED